MGSAPSSSSYYSGSRGFTGSSYGWGPVYRPWRYGYYSGAFVPVYGYGYGYYTPAPGYAMAQGETYVRPEPSNVRVTLGVEGLYSLSTTNGSGYVLGLSGLFEGDRFGVSIHAQTIQTQLNQLVQLNAHLTFAFLTGKYGRLRVEAGADTFFAEDLIVMAPTGGLSGQLWIAGPVALEGSILATPWPIFALDFRGGVVVGIDSIGLRAGWRVQRLEDRGIVPGTPDDTRGCTQLNNGNWSCTDLINGPYVGIGIAF
ncbi:MAG: hypothetical protein JNJ54_01040 [Myxococcaceae bacterium]|nr:hypothetical protein [Myxococcaceae bacterium]